MKSFIIAIMLMVPASSFACTKIVRVKLSQTSYTLNVWKHIRNAVNANEIDLPFSCEAANGLTPGQSLLNKKFRWGSLMVGGSFGNWNLDVVSIGPEIN